MMDSVAELALDKLKASKGVRDNVLPGSYTVNELVRLTGTINVAEDEEATATVAIPLLETLALCLVHAGFTRDRTRKIVIQSCKDAVEAKGKGKGAILETLALDKRETYSKVLEMVESIKAEIALELPKMQKKGKVTTNLTAVAVQSNVVRKAA